MDKQEVIDLFKAKYDKVGEVKPRGLTNLAGQIYEVQVKEVDEALLTAREKTEFFTVYDEGGATEMAYLGREDTKDSDFKAMVKLAIDAKKASGTIDGYAVLSAKVISVDEEERCADVRMVVAQPTLMRECQERMYHLVVDPEDSKAILFSQMTDQLKKEWITWLRNTDSVGVA